MHLDLRPPRHLVPFRRRRQQRAGLGIGEHLRGPLPGRAVDLCVPKTSSKSCDQAIFVDQATDASVSSDAVWVEIDRFG